MKHQSSDVLLYCHGAGTGTDRQSAAVRRAAALPGCDQSTINSDDEQAGAHHESFARTHAFCTARPGSTTSSYVVDCR